MVRCLYRDASQVRFNPTRIEYKAVNVISSGSEKHNLTAVDIDTMISIGLAAKTISREDRNGDLPLNLMLLPMRFLLPLLKIEDAVGL